MLKRIAVSVLNVVLVLVMTGCSLFAPKDQMISINGEPAGARVLVNGNVMTVPGTLSVKRNKNVHIMVTKPGYHPYAITTGYTLSQYGTLDLIGTFVFLVPVVGLITPGAYELEQDTFYYSLTQEGK